MPDGSSVGEDMLEWEGRRKLHTGDVVCDIFDGPPITQWGKERWKGALRADKVDDAELVVDVEGAAFILQDEALLRRGEGETGDCNKEQRSAPHVRSRRRCSRPQRWFKTTAGSSTTGGRLTCQVV